MNEVPATITRTGSWPRWWADPDSCEVTGGLRTIFSESGCEQLPSGSEASYPADHLVNGCRIGGQTTRSCRIFAAMAPRYAGREGRRLLTKADMQTDTSRVEHMTAGVSLDRLWDRHGSPIPITIEGNPAGQQIRGLTRPLRDPVLGRRICGLAT